MAANVGSAFD